MYMLLLVDLKEYDVWFFKLYKYFLTAVFSVIYDGAVSSVISKSNGLFYSILLKITTETSLFCVNKCVKF